jgi:hypothetical protein
VSEAARGYLDVPGLWTDEQVEAWKPTPGAPSSSRRTGTPAALPAQVPTVSKPELRSSGCREPSLLTKLKATEF